MYIHITLMVIALLIWFFDIRRYLNGNIAIFFADGANAIAMCLMSLIVPEFALIIIGVIYYMHLVDTGRVKLVGLAKRFDNIHMKNR